MTYYEHEDFTDLKMENETISNLELEDCRFLSCELQSVRFHNCRFVDCTFSECLAENPVFDCCSMSGSIFTSCRLLGIDWETLSGGFVGPIERLENCLLKYNNFVNGEFPRFTFSGNEILDSLFGSCNLTRCDFSSCHLNKTEFFQCDLSGTDFTCADGYSVDISNCQLKGAVFSYPDVINLLNGLGIIIK